VKNSTPKAANSGKRGSPVAYLPKERRGESLFEPMTILENFALPSLNEDRTAGFINSKKMASRFQVFVDSLRIKFNQSSDAISTLSGGNQQKILFARWIATAPRVLLLNDPTRGVDISTKREIYSLLEKLCSEGMSVVILSSEVEELVEVVDRVLVFRDQSVFRELSGEDITIQTIVAGYFGQLLESER
jgi:ABC-type sugar transport system ATPase subunit